MRCGGRGASGSLADHSLRAYSITRQLFSRIHIFLLLTLLATVAYAAEPARKVKATEEIAYKAKVDKGSVGGRIPKGTELEVIGEEGENLSVRFGRLTITVPKKSTDYFVPVGDLHASVAALDKSTEGYLGPTNASLKPDQAPHRVFTKEELNNAYYSARNSIREVLKAPSTAKFSNPQLDPAGTGATPDDAGRIICKGYVEAQNSFGVPLRQKWVAWVQPEGSKQWRIVYAVLDGNILRDDRNQHKTDQTLSAEQFLGMSREEMLRTLGQPIDVKEGNNSDDGGFKIYSFSNEKGKETFFTIWDSDGKITSGMYRGTSFSE